jgi:uncharacterized protein YjbJ (UPF0337 family)
LGNERGYRSWVSVRADPSGREVAVAVNWGIAAVVYLFVGATDRGSTCPQPPFSARPKSGGSMSGKQIDRAKGRAKEAAGALTGNRRLKNEGRVDQAKGSAKNAVDKVAGALTGGKRAKR